jgi:two-component system chemotaxis response regulator CheY
MPRIYQHSQHSFLIISRPHVTRAKYDGEIRLMRVCSREMLRLPITAGVARQSLGHTFPAPIQSGRPMKKILLVDDSRAVRLVGRRLVTAMGFEVLEAEDGQQALDVSREHQDIDVVLLDWNMPVMDGLTFLKALREDTRERQPVVVMCTDALSMSRIVETMQAGANEYIMKPFTEDIVREKLQETGVL